MPISLPYLLLGLLCLLLCLFLLLLAKNRVSKEKGIAGERRVAKVLRRFGRRNGCKLWNNAYLPLYHSCCEIDHLLFGRFGVLVVETKNIGGTVSGRGDTLTHTMGRHVYKMRNPRLQNKTHRDNVQYHLRKAGLGQLPIYEIVVFSNPGVRLETDTGIYLSRLSEFLRQLPDRHCDGDAAYEALRSVRIRSPFKKLFHDIQVGQK